MAEQIILQGLCNQVKGAVVENGHGMLTNQRFIYSKHSLAHIAVMGALVNLTRGDFDFDIPLADITEVEETKRLFSKILVIHTKDAEYRFFFTKLEEWKIAFANALEGKSDTEQVQAVPRPRTGARCSTGCIPAGPSATGLPIRSWTIWKAMRPG